MINAFYLLSHGKGSRHQLSPANMVQETIAQIVNSKNHTVESRGHTMGAPVRRIVKIASPEYILSVYQVTTYRDIISNILVSINYFYYNILYKIYIRIRSLYVIAFSISIVTLLFYCPIFFIEPTRIELWRIFSAIPIIVFLSKITATI
jgi:hypothetical protein